MPLIPVRFADDCIPCPDCGEPWREVCSQHYADCECIGPHNAEEHGTLVEVDGKLYCDTDG